MDHLPKPLDHEHVCAPFYAEARVYTPDEFYSLPSKYGSIPTLDLIEQGLPETMPANIANEFLQSWLWFALLSAVTGKDVDANEFRSLDHHGNFRVDTYMGQLNNCIASWKQREEDAKDRGDTDGQILRYIRASSALDDARKFVYKHCSYQSFDRDNYQDYENAWFQSNSEPLQTPNVDKKMTLSLAIIGETLQREQPEIADSLAKRTRFWDAPSDLPKTWGHSKYLRDKLLGQNWCPRSIRRLELTMRNVSGVYFAYSRKEPPPKTENHTGCTFWKCVALSRKLQRHSDGTECRCPTISPNEAEIERIVEMGSIPLVEYDATGQLKIIPVDRTQLQNFKFGALSYSWNDGLLPAARNRRGMPRCQLQQLRRTFNKAAECTGARNIPFWVDVLCLPLQDEILGRAINQMRDIYGGASTVLVWDADLLKTTLGKDLVEVNVRITLGGWAKRLWTLQEGILARDLRFEFRGEELVSTKDLEQRRNQARDDLWDSHHHVWEAGHPFSAAMWSLKKREATHQVEQVWQAVQFRSSTFPSDETVCLANLLEMDAEEITKITSTKDDEDLSTRRMIRFLNLLEEDRRLGIPSAIIFLPGPKLNDQHYSWAPASWMTEQAYKYPLHRNLRRIGQISRLGFSVEFPGILLYPPKVPVDHKFWLPVSQNLHKWYKVVANTRGPKWAQLWRAACADAKERPCIILSSYEPRGDYEIGVLARTKGILARREEARWAEILCRVWVRLETNHSVIGRLCTAFRENMDNMLWGERLDDDQKWCVQ